MAPDATLGPRLREIRKERGLALAEVAEGTGISVSFLSLIETGKSDVTFTRLNRLVAFYGIHITDLLPEPASTDPIVVRRVEQQHIYSPAEGIELILLTRDTRHTMLPILAVYSPGAEARFDAREGEGFVLVLEGKLELGLNGREPIILNAGDSAYYPLDVPHAYRNPDDRPTRVLGVGTPPPF
jgi:transcriptional regulator with XRE-family HTH domain